MEGEVSKNGLRRGKGGRGAGKSSTRASNARSGLSTVVCTGIAVDHGGRGIYESVQERGLSLTASVTKNYKMAACPTAPNKGLGLSVYAYCTSTCQSCISLYDPSP